MPAGNRFCTSDANQILNLVLRAQAATFPASWYYALVTTAPTDDTGTGLVEVAGGGYARVGVTRGLAGYTAPASRACAHAANVQWPTATADWAAGTTKVVGIALFDASTGGTYRGYAALATAVNVLTGGAPFVTAANFQYAA